jgi:hypothetical protein
MGRTVPTFTNLIDAEIASWSKFRRGLRKEDQDAFDEIFRAAKKHLAENFYAMRPVPFESVIISILVEQQKAINRIQKTGDRMQKTGDGIQAAEGRKE